MGVSTNSPWHAIIRIPLPQGCNGAIQVKIADTDNEKQQKRLLNSLTSMAPLPALQAYQQVIRITTIPLYTELSMLYCCCVYCSYSNNKCSSS